MGPFPSSDSRGDLPRLVVVGWWNEATGLGRVLRRLVAGLKSHWRIEVAAVGYRGPVVYSSGSSVHPTNLTGGDVFGAYAARDLIRATNPQAILVFADLWHLERYARILAPDRPEAELLVYLPLDGEFVDPELARPLLLYDRVAVYTQWARREVETAFRSLGQSRPVSIVPHGVDHQAFFPHSELLLERFRRKGRKKAKERVFGSNFDPRTWVVLNANRPCERKRIDLTLQGFSVFSKRTDTRAQLCLHQAIRRPEDQEQLEAWIHDLGLEEKVCINPLGSEPLEEGELNWLFNACDVGLNTSMGEGWGLLSFEHGAAGAAQIVPGHSAPLELWKNRAEILPVKARYRPRFSTLEMGEVDPHQVAVTLNRLYDDEDLESTWARKDWEMSQRSAFCWSEAVQAMERFLIAEKK